MKNKNNFIVYKPNELIEIVGNPISITGLVTYNFLLHKFQNLKTDKIIISMSEIFNSLNISDNYEELFSYLDSLRKVGIISRDSKGKLWGGFNLLSEFKKVDDGVFIQIPNTIFKALCGDEKEKNLYYTTIKLLEQRIYKCSYTIILYEIFKKYEQINIPIFTLEELKEITGTVDTYLEYKYFKRDVLSKAIKEINQFDSKFEYSFEEKKLGKKVNEIKFIKKEKNVIDINSSEKNEIKKNKVIKKDKLEVNDNYSQGNKRTQLEIEKEKLSLIILNSKLQTRERIILFGKLAAIENMEDLKKLEKKVMEIYYGK